MASNDVTAYRVATSPTGRASVQFTHGQTTMTPPSPVIDISVSKCPGVIEPYLHPNCKLTTSFINFNAITIFNRLPPGYNNQDDLAGLGCYAPEAETYYVNVRWSFASCPYGPGQCGFHNQWNEGPY
jgi:hypothetical protein